MATIPFALSISHFVNSVGADAGFAAIIGLAILVLLYFAQARETATLREHAAEASERIRQLEARIGHLLRAQSQAPAPPPAQALRQSPAPVRTAAAAGAAAPTRVPAGIGATVARVAPAGVAAPALTAATKLIPTDAPGSATALAEPPPPIPDDGNHTGAATAAGANGYARPRPAGAQRIPAPVGAGQSPPRVQIRPGAAPGAGGRRPTLPPRGLEPEDDAASPLGRRIVYGAAALVVLAVIVVGLILLTSTGSRNAPANTGASRTTNAPTTTKRHHARTATVIPSTVTVSVLNGTATTNMAATVSGRLGAVGFKPGKIANALDQTHTATVVQYLPGHKAAALAVAKSLKLSNSAVSAIDPTTLASACQAPPGSTVTVQPGGCYANPAVVVTVGADLAGGSTTTSTGASGTATGASGTATGASGATSGGPTTTAP